MLAHVTFARVQRLRTLSGRYVFVCTLHKRFVAVYLDRSLAREVDEWWLDPDVDAVVPRMVRQTVF